MDCDHSFVFNINDLFALVTDHQLASIDLDAPCQALFDVADERLQRGCWCDPTKKNCAKCDKIQDNEEKLETNAHRLLKKRLPCMSVKLNIKQRSEHPAKH